MPCAIEKEVFDKVKVVFKPKFFGYTGYTSSNEYAKTIKTINFANSANKYIGYTGFTGFTGYGEPTEYTNSSDKPYHYPCKDIVKAASEEHAEIARHHKELMNAIRPIVYTDSSNWVDLVKYDDYSKDSIKIFEATPEKPKNTLWQAIQIMIFDYICSINNRYDLNIPLDLVG